MGNLCDIPETLDDNYDYDKDVEDTKKAMVGYKRYDAYLTRGASFANNCIIPESFKY